MAHPWPIILLETPHTRKDLIETVPRHGGIDDHPCSISNVSGPFHFSMPSAAKLRSRVRVRQTSPFTWACSFHLNRSEQAGRWQTVRPFDSIRCPFPCKSTIFGKDGLSKRGEAMAYVARHTQGQLTIHLACQTFNIPVAGSQLATSRSDI